MSEESPRPSTLFGITPASLPDWRGGSYLIPQTNQFAPTEEQIAYLRDLTTTAMAANPLPPPPTIDYTTMAIPVAKKAGWPMFNGPNRRTCVMRMNYFINLATALEIDLEHTTVFEIFCNDLNTPPDKRVINRLIHERSPLIPSERLSPLLIHAMADRLKEAGKKIKDYTEQSAIDNRDYFLRQALNHQQQMYIKLAEANKYMSYRRKNNEIDIVTPINALLEMGFYSMESINVSSGVVAFITKPISLTHCDPEQGIDITVNIGQLYVDFNLVKFSCIVSAGCSTVKKDGFFHPYISNNGEPCLGDEFQAANDAMKACDVAQYLRVIQSVLTYYNPRSTPYVTLVNLAAAYHQESDRRQARFFNNNGLQPIGWSLTEMGSEPGLIESDDRDNEEDAENVIYYGT